jgi:peptidyl-prolyl cis-trans isomerase SurA
MVVVSLVGVTTSAEVIDRIVAVVGDSPILLSEVEESMAFARAAGDTTGEAELRQAVLDQLIEDRVVVETARRDGLEAPPREVEEEASRREQQLRDQFAEPEQFAAQLEREGLTEAQFRRLQEEMARDQILARMMLETVRQTWKVDVTEAEIDSFYYANLSQLPMEPERVELCHLLVGLGPDPDEEQRVVALARELVTRSESGEDFGELAREFSEGPSAERGGDLGFIERGQVLPAFEEAVFSLEAGHIGGPVRTDLGYHVVKLEEKQGDRVRARHILLTVGSSEGQREAARVEADSLWRAIIEGASFDDLVRESSDDTTTRGEGGCLGLLSVPSLSPEVQQTLDTLQVGQVSAPVEQEDGYHLYLAKRRVPQGPAPITEIGPRIRLVLQQQKLEEKYRGWVRDLREDIYVHVF